MKQLAVPAALAQEPLASGATRTSATEFFFDDIGHYLFAGDTPLHAAAAAYQAELAALLVELGADVRARNRRGAEPLHYAADGGPGVRGWRPEAQAAVIALLVEKGANPNVLNKSGVAPLHRAIRYRSLLAVKSLLLNGASVRMRNKNGSTPLHLAVQDTGKGGTGSSEAKAAQLSIIQLLLQSGASLDDRDSNGNTPLQCAQSGWIAALLA